jgi:hypothetical protein
MTTTTENAPRPPDGDWLGTPFLRFDREGPFGVVTLDRPEARNAMTPAMYFGIRYAITHVETDDDLAGLLITGTGDVFAPGGDLGGGNGVDDWMSFGSALSMDVTPFETLRQSVKPWCQRSTVCVRAVDCRSRCAAMWRWSATARRSGFPSCTAGSPTPTTPRRWPGSSGRSGPGI